MVEILLTFLAPIVANVVSYYICKWPNKDK